MAIKIDKIVEEFDLTEAEKEVIVDSGNTANTVAMHQARVASEFILGKKIENATERVIESNEKHSKAIVMLTGALVFVGAVQLVFTFFTLFTTLLKELGAVPAIAVTVLMVVAIGMILYLSRSFWSGILKKYK